MKRSGYWDQKDARNRAKVVLAKGGVVASTTDTVIGLLAPLTEKGKQSLDRIKKRRDKPYLVLVRDSAMASYFSDVVKSKKLQPLLDASWPGPLTIIVPARDRVADFIKSATGMIALRVPRHTGLQEVLASVNGLFSTSANKSGAPIPPTIESIDPEIIDQVALIIDDREKNFKHPSTIIDCTGDKCILIREGEYSRQYIARYIAIEK